MAKKLIYALLLCICVSGIHGCKKYYVIETTQKDGQLIFKSNELFNKCDGYITVHSFGIEYIGEKERRVAWDIRKKKTNKRKDAQDLPLKYGIKLPGFEIRVEPMEIFPGKYRIGSDMACYSGNDIRSLTVFGEFVIDSTNNLVLEPR